MVNCVLPLQVFALLINLGIILRKTCLLLLLFIFGGFFLSNALLFPQALVGKQSSWMGMAVCKRKPLLTLDCSGYPEGEFRFIAEFGAFCGFVCKLLCMPRCSRGIA